MFVKQEVGGFGVADDFFTAIVNLDPRRQMIDLYTLKLTVASFQGSSDIKNRACAALGITNEQIAKVRVNQLDSFFAARNDVAHRLDLLQPTGSSPKPRRKQRNQDEVGRMCDNAILLVRDVIKATAANLKKSPASDMTSEYELSSGLS